MDQLARRASRDEANQFGPQLELGLGLGLGVHLGDRGDRLGPQLLRGEDFRLRHIGLARAVALE